MNILRKDINKRNKIRPLILIFILYTITIFTAQYFYSDYLFNVSKEWTKKIQKDDNFINILPILETFSNFIGTYRMFGLIVLFVYNSANISKSFALIMVCFICNYVSAILKILYHSPFLYYEDDNGSIIPSRCQGGWGNPSENSLTSTCVFLTLWKIVFDCGRLRFKKNAKIISLICLILLIIIVNLCKLFAGLSSLDQIIFGMTVGFMIFFFIFYVIRIDLNNGRGLTKIVNFHLFYYLLINLVLAGGIVLVHFFLSGNNELIEKYNTNITKTICYDKINNISKIHDNLKYDNEAFIICATFFGNIGILIGLKFEYKYMFNSNELNWRQYNFDKEEGDEESLLSKLSISKETQWNHTTFFFSFLRIIFVALISIIFLLPTLFIPFNWNLAIILIFKIILPYNLVVFNLFYLNKIILQKLSLTNDSIFTLINDSI